MDQQEITNTQLAVAIARIETKLDQALENIKINTKRLDAVEKYQTQTKTTLVVLKFLWAGLIAIGGFVVSWIKIKT
jgi:hypothetical protein